MNDMIKIKTGTFFEPKIINQKNWNNIGKNKRVGMSEE